ncbi:MAG: hypothetical protein EZS28_028481, partial [Streblomastix strix]
NQVSVYQIEIYEQGATFFHYFKGQNPSMNVCRQRCKQLYDRREKETTRLRRRVNDSVRVLVIIELDTGKVMINRARQRVNDTVKVLVIIELDTDKQ